MIGHVMAFMLGAALDAAWVVWMTATRENRPGAAAVVSMVIGAAGILGMDQALNQGHGVALVLGYGFGTYASTRLLGKSA